MFHYVYRRRKMEFLIEVLFSKLWVSGCCLFISGNFLSRISLLASVQSNNVHATFSSYIPFKFLTTPLSTNSLRQGSNEQISIYRSLDHHHHHNNDNINNIEGRAFRLGILYRGLADLWRGLFSRETSFVHHKPDAYDSRTSFPSFFLTLGASL